MTQLTPDGQLDTTFGSGGVATISLAADSNEYVSGATLDPQGRVVAVGSVRLGTITTGTWAGYVARFTAAGAPGRVLRRLRQRHAACSTTAAASSATTRPSPT